MTALEQTTTLPGSPTLLAKLVALGKRVGQPPVTSEPMFPPQSPRLPTPAENAGGVRDESVLSLVVALGCGSFGSLSVPGDFAVGAVAVSSAAALTGFPERHIFGEAPGAAPVYVDDTLLITARVGMAMVIYLAVFT